MLFSSEKPQRLSEIAGNQPAMSEIKKWADAWEKGGAQKPLLIFGPPGTGKTSIAYALASEYGWGIFEFNASDLRDEAAAERFLANASLSGSLFGKRKLILIDDVDSLSPQEDKGGLAAISKIITSSKQPTILTAIDYYDKKLQGIRGSCTPVKLQRVYLPTILSLLKKIAAKHKVEVSEKDLAAVASASGGDVRAALNDLQARNLSARRDSQKNIFEVVRAIFKSSAYSEARRAAFDSETEHDTLKLWIAENIPVEYEKPFDIAEAYNSLSRADVFDGRILKRQYWGFLRYSSDHISAGVAVAKSSRYSKFSTYAYPNYIKEMGATKSSRQLRKAILRKIALACHCSMRQAEAYLFLLNLLSSKDAQGTAKFFGFNEDELQFLASLPSNAAASRGAGRQKSGG
ncbi:MAG: replication factor C large subunit [Candidatus Micrarchaeota archaeon]|nr:replication factor C large subunit [Candidatus Micrarchaeota archaeon]